MTTAGSPDSGELDLASADQVRRPVFFPLGLIVPSKGDPAGTPG